MDIGAEISKKIQMAITAKLKELNAYVDDELPDYIMIMVANRKTEDQMTDALSLFLSENTRTFTSWLHNLLATLRKAKTSKTDGTAKPAVAGAEDKSKRAAPVMIADGASLTRIEEKADEVQVNDQHRERKHVEKPEVKRHESSSEAIISINPETDDMLDEELMLHQTDTSLLLHDSSIEMEPGTDVPPQKEATTTTQSQQSRTETDKKALVDYSEGDKDENESLEPDKMPNENSKHRRESESRTTDRKRKSDEHRSRRSHRSRSPAAKNRKDDKSRERKDTKTKSPPRRRKHDVRRMYGLESDSKQYAKSAEKVERKMSVGEPVIREWDKGKGEDGDGEIISSWDRRKRESDAKAKLKDSGEWSSTDEEEMTSKRKGSVASAVKPVMPDVEFVSDSESGDDGGKKSSAITSKVAYPERKIRVPLAKQANRALLMKAVSEAEKSVRRKRATQLDDVEDTTIYSQPKKPQKSKSSTKNKEEWVEKPAKIRRRSKEDKSERSEIMEKVMNRPMYQDLEGSEKRHKRRKDVIIVHKNVVTGDRISTTSKQSHKELKDADVRESRRKKHHQKPAKVILLEDGDEERPLTVIHVRRNSQAKKRDQVIYVEGSSSDDATYQDSKAFRRDKRNFIHRVTAKKSPEGGKSSDGEGTSAGVSSSVKFDSRQAKAHSGKSPPLQPKVVEKKKQKATAKVSPRPHSKAPPADLPPTSKAMIKLRADLRTEGSQSPRFIVTLDGVATSAQNATKGVQPTQGGKDFMYNPVTAPVATKALTNPVLTAKVSSPVQKPVVIDTGEAEDNHDDFTGEVSDTELGKMRQKLLKVQEEATKLKQMQAKLAAAQAQRSALLQSGGMYADKIDSEQRSIYVANVNYSTTEKQLSEYFSICGKVERATILKDQFTGHPKGFGYLQFEDKRAVSSALALDNTRLNNRVIRVTLKQSRPAAPATYSASPRGRRFVPRRAYSYRQSASYYGGRYAAPGPRYLTSGPPATRPTSRNKTWVNPSLSAQK